MLTHEQEEIIKSALKLKNNEVLKINAFAGTGKTTTLVNITKANNQIKYLYLAFNNSIVKEAKKKFDNNVDVFTVHSLALKTLDKKTKIKHNDYDILTIQTLFSIKDENLFLCNQILKSFKAFCISDIENINNLKNIYPDINSDVLTYTAKLWTLMSNREIEVNHDFYLKEFSLNDTLIQILSANYDVILLDEAQDSNPVTLAIFTKLKGRKILVGDKYQQIYQFRGSMNAMDVIRCDYEFFLTYTFRCSEEVVYFANEVLTNYLGSTKKLISKQNQNMPENYNVAFIARTNASLIELIDNFKDQDDGFFITRNINEIFNTAINIHFFLANEKEKISKEYLFLKKFNDELDLKDYIDSYDLVELSSSLKIAKRYKGYLFVLKKITRENSNNKSNIILTTVHASKGLEWDRVVLMKDFKNLNKIDEEKLIEEANLLYVAITRAKYKIDFLSKDDL